MNKQIELRINQLYVDTYNAQKTGRKAVSDGNGLSSVQGAQAAKRTLFQRTVAWLKNPFGFRGNGGNVNQEEAAAVNVAQAEAKSVKTFSNLLKEGFPYVGRAISSLAQRKLQEGIPLAKVILASTARARKVEQALVRVLPSASKEFYKAAEAAGVNTGELSDKQLMFAATLIKFEVAARIEAGAKSDAIKNDLQDIARSALSLAQELGNGGIPEDLWFNGESIGTALVKLNNPHAFMVLDREFRSNNGKYAGLSYIKSNIEKVVNPIIRESINKAAHPVYNIVRSEDSRQGDEEDSRQGGELAGKSETSIRPKHEELRQIVASTSENFDKDWKRMDVILPINTTTKVEKGDDGKFKWEGAFSALAQQSPGFDRVLNNVDEDDSEKLESFKEVAESLKPEEDLAIITLKGKREQIEGKTKDELTLYASRNKDGDIEISAEMKAQMANSRTREEAFEELTAFAGGDQEKARQLTRLLHTGVGEFPLNLARKTLPYSQDRDHSSYTLRPSLKKNGDVVVNVKANAVLTEAREVRTPKRDGSGFVVKKRVPLNPDGSEIDLNWTFTVGNDSLRKGEPGVEEDDLLGDTPLDVTLRVRIPPPSPDGILDSTNSRDAEEIASRNKQLLELYLPGGPKADKVGIHAGRFSEPQEKLIKIMMEREVKNRGGTEQLEYKDMQVIAKKATDVVSGFTAPKANAIVVAHTNLSDRIDRIGVIISSRNPNREKLHRALESAAEWRDALMDAWGIDRSSSTKRQNFLFDFFKDELKDWGSSQVGPFVDRAFTLPQVQHYLTLGLIAKTEGRQTTLRKRVAAAGEVLTSILGGALTHLGRGDELEGKVGEALGATMGEQGVDAWRMVNEWLDKEVDEVDDDIDDFVMINADSDEVDNGDEAMATQKFAEILETKTMASADFTDRLSVEGRA